MPEEDEGCSTTTTTDAAAATAPRYVQWREYASGWTAAVVNIFVTFPVNKMVFRQVVHGFSVSEAFHQLHKEGANTLYRGILPPLIQKSCSSSIMFGSYFQYRRYLLDNYPDTVNPFRAHVAAGLLSGSTEALLAPLERVQVLMQDTKFHDRFRNTGHVFLELRGFGIREYYRGLSAILIRNGPSNVIFFGARSKVKELLPESWVEGPYSSGLCDFVSGACVGALISTLFYPVNVTKTHMQIKLGGNFQSFTSVFRLLLRERGIIGMFRGVHINYTRSFMSWGIINTTYEYVHKYLNKIYPKSSLNHELKNQVR